MLFSYDYLSFTIKPDKNAQYNSGIASRNPYHIQLWEVLDMLRFTGKDKDALFSHDYGCHRNYDHTYIYNGIHVYATQLAMEGLDRLPCVDLGNNEELAPNAEDKYYTYGINIEMKGSGCRFFEKRCNDDPDCYRILFGKLLMKVHDGASFKVCRVDYAMDDKVRKGEYDGTGQPKKPMLDLDLIQAIIDNKCDIENNNDEVSPDNSEIFSSLYRSFNPTISTQKLKYYDTNTNTFESGYFKGKTVYFGSHQSSSFCKFYDKFVEQHVQHQNDLQYLRDELSQLTHWVRFEMTFKDDVAMKIINSYLNMDDKHFSKFLSVTINSYLRFLVFDDSTITRCSLSPWWSDFIGAVEHSKMSVQGFIVNPAYRAVKWIQSCGNTYNALIKNLGADVFLGLILDAERPEKYSGKHKLIMDAEDFSSDKVYSNLQKWSHLKPEHKPCYDC